MESEALRTFLAIHHLGGFSQAARVLNRTQPAISRRIALLEDELGAPLFDRISGRVVLSQAGRMLLPYAERALAAIEDCAAVTQALLAETSGPVSIVVVGTLASTNLTAVLKSFAVNFKAVELRLSTATSVEVSDRVRRGEAVIGLRYLHDPSPDIIGTLLGTEKLVVASSADHPLAHKKVASLTDLRSETWLAFPSAYDQREAYADNIFAQFLACGIGAVRWTPVDSLTAQKRLIEAGFGIALLPESGLYEELRSRSLATIEVQGLDVANPIYAVTRKGGYLSPAAEELLNRLKSDLVTSTGKSRRSKSPG